MSSCFVYGPEESLSILSFLLLAIKIIDLIIFEFI